MLKYKKNVDILYEWSPSPTEAVVDMDVPCERFILSLFLSRGPAAERHAEQGAERPGGGHQRPRVEDEPAERRPHPGDRRPEDEADAREPVPAQPGQQEQLGLLRRLQDQGLRRRRRGEPHLPGRQFLAQFKYGGLYWSLCKFQGPLPNCPRNFHY